MLYVGTVDVVFHFHAKEAAAARWVGKQIEAIARTDERRDAGQLSETLLIGLTNIKGGHLHQVLQQWHLGFGIFIEFIHVQQSHFRQEPFGLSLRYSSASAHQALASDKRCSSGAPAPG